MPVPGADTRGPSRLFGPFGALTLVLWLLLTSRALAHWADLAAAEVVVGEQDARVSLTLPTGLVKAADDDHDGAVSPAEAQRHEADLLPVLGDGIQLQAAGAAGTLTLEAPAGRAPVPDLGQRGQTHSTLGLRYTWPTPVHALTMTYRLFVPGVSTARCVATVITGNQVREVVFTPTTPTLALGEDSRVSGALSFVGLGMEHILTGYDHMLFLVSLLMLGGGLGYLIKVVTAFTLAHTLTLSLAFFSLVNVPSRWVESAIALTIAYVAAETFWRKDLKGRWVLTFGFGLVHGLGFASALREMAIPRDALVASLLSFNVGVEIGQLLIVATAYGLLRWIRRQAWDLAFRRTVSAAVIVMALVWFFERALG